MKDSQALQNKLKELGIQSAGYEEDRLSNDLLNTFVIIFSGLQDELIKPSNKQEDPNSESESDNQEDIPDYRYYHFVNKPFNVIIIEIKSIIPLIAPSIIDHLIRKILIINHQSQLINENLQLKSLLKKVITYI